MKTIAEQLNVKDFPFRIYDKNGNQIYYEKSDKFWAKHGYDSNGREIYYEDSNKYWSKREYDSNGNQNHYENSFGTIVDSRPKSCDGKEVEVDGVKYKLTRLWKQ